MPEMPELSFELGFRKTVDKSTQNAILKEVEQLTLQSPRIYLAIKWLCTYVSIRPGELRGILEDDIDLKQGLLFIRDHKTVRHKGPKVVPLLDEDVNLVSSLPRGFPSMPFFRHDVPIKGMPANTRFGNRVLRKVWNQACEKLEIEGVGLYGGTRHSTMQFLRSLGKSKEDVKVLSDHSTNKALDRYLEKNFDEMRAGYALTREVKKASKRKSSAPILHLPKQA
jgi:integrase